MQFLIYESCNFGVIDITPTSQAGQSISQEQATKLASEYAEHFGYGAITQTHCDKSQEPLLSRLGQILVLDDYLYQTTSGAVLYNLGCVFCDLEQCKAWDEKKAYKFLQEIYPQKVRANPLGFNIYAQRLVDKTQGSVEYASKAFKA